MSTRCALAVDRVETLQRSLRGCRPRRRARLRVRAAAKSERRGGDQDADSDRAPSVPISISRRQLYAAAGSAVGFGRLSSAFAATTLSDDAAAASKKTRRKNSNAGLAERVSAFTMPNGLRFLVVERHFAPVITCHTYADVGAFEETDGLTGLAHLLEHLAFKGSVRIGAKSYEEERLLLQDIDQIYYTLRDEIDEHASPQRIAELKDKLRSLELVASKLAVPNEFGSILQKEGGVGLNAATSHDSTEYFVSMPSNKLELWMAMEAERFRYPVFRGLYSEKEVIVEERKLRVDNNPVGQLMEQFSATAFEKSAYRRPIIGYQNDFERLGRREVETFFLQHYQPEALTISVVGDVNPSQVEAFAVKYFGDWENSALVKSGSPKVRKEPKQKDFKELRLKLKNQPLYIAGYHRPSCTHPDNYPISVLCEVLNGGRSSRFYKELFETGKALGISAEETYPGDKRENLLLLSGLPVAGSTTDAVSDNLTRVLDGIFERPIREDELVKVQKFARVGLQALFSSNASIAATVARYTALTGDWENMLKEPDKIAAVTVNDIERVAAYLFQKSNCTAGHIVSV